MVAVVSSENAGQVISELEAAGENVHHIGRLVARSTDGCVLKNLVSWD
jgi:phosphoribosylamine--glycine ligase/phosphoribosylformylglycinamidine cyclo-ligase